MRQHFPLVVCGLQLCALTLAGVAQAQLVTPDFVRVFPVYHETPGQPLAIYVECEFPGNQEPFAVEFKRWYGEDTSGTLQLTEPRLYNKFLDEAVFASGDYYTYACRACDDTIKKRNCGAMSPPFTTSIELRWPVQSAASSAATTADNHYDVLDGFNEVIAWGTSQRIEGRANDVSTGYHDGLDLNAPYDLSKQARVVAMRGGEMLKESVTSTMDADNGQVIVRVIVGFDQNDSPQYQHDYYNHLATPIAKGGSATQLPANILERRSIRPGQHIGNVGRKHFRGVLNDHVHLGMLRIDSTTTKAASSVSYKNPLLLFPEAQPQERDPNGNPPGFFDENKDGKYVIFRKHVTESDVGSTGFSYGPGIPWPRNGDPPVLSGDIDIAVEVADDQGDHPRVAPRKLGYWIEGPRPGVVDQDDVKSDSAPYVLFDFDKEYYGGTLGPSWQSKKDPTPCNFLVDISDDANAGCNFGGVPAGCRGLPKTFVRTCTNLDITEPGSQPATGYDGPVLHHFIVTHAEGETGDRKDVKVSEFWNTDANDEDGPLPSTTANANYSKQIAGNRATKASKARFPDGEYKLHAVIWDSVNRGIEDRGIDRLVPSSLEDFVEPLRMRLENFAPIIEELTIGQDAQVDDRGFVGTDDNSCGVVLYGYKYEGPPTDYPGPRHLNRSRIELLDPLGGARFCVRIRFSESIYHRNDGNDGLKIELRTIEESGSLTGQTPLSLVASSWSTAYSTDDEWRGIFLLDPGANGRIKQEVGLQLLGLMAHVEAYDRPDLEAHKRFLDVDNKGAESTSNADRHHRVVADDIPPATLLGIQLGEWVEN
jgi:hypothetical protein